MLHEHIFLLNNNVLKQQNLIHIIGILEFMYWCRATVLILFSVTLIKKIFGMEMGGTERKERAGSRHPSQHPTRVMGIQSQHPMKVMESKYLVHALLPPRHINRKEGSKHRITRTSPSAAVWMKASPCGRLTCRATMPGLLVQKPTYTLLRDATYRLWNTGT